MGLFKDLVFLEELGEGVPFWKMAYPFLELEEVIEAVELSLHLVDDLLHSLFSPDECVELV